MSSNGCSPPHSDPGITVSWAELWDQHDAVSNHTQKGIDFLERLGTFAKERAAIEEEYAAKLRGLAKKSLGKKKEDEEAIKAFSNMAAFANYLRELESLAAQHEVIAERVRKEVCPFIVSRVNQHRIQRKQCLTELQTIYSTLNTATEQMHKAQKNYGKTFKDAEAAYLKYDKAEKNMEISRLDLEKAKNNAQARSQICEEAKHGYAHALQAANDAQAAHYSQHLPDALERMKLLDQERIRDTRTTLEMSIAADVAVHNIILRCHEDMKKAISYIDADRDAARVVEMYKSGYMRPPPSEFVDYGKPDGILRGGESISDTMKKGTLGSASRKEKIPRKPSMHTKIFGGGDKHKAEANGDYGQLPPQQRVRKLQAKIGELEKSLDKSNSAKEGVLRMQQAYTANPKLGNPADCEDQLAQYGREIDSLTQQLSKFRMMLDDAQNHLPIGGADTPPSIRSGSSASSVPPRPNPPAGQRSSYSEESVTSSDGGGARNHADRRDEMYEECAMPALGTATAQFSYDGGTEGTMKITDGEELLLIEKDEGDGWTRVRRVDAAVEGFVPTSYLKCKWYPSE